MLRTLSSNNTREVDDPASSSQIWQAAFDEHHWKTDVRVEDLVKVFVSGLFEKLLVPCAGVVDNDVNVLVKCLHGGLHDFFRNLRSRWLFCPAKTYRQKVRRCCVWRWGEDIH